LPSGRSRTAKVAAYINKAAFAALPAGTATGEGDVSYDSVLSDKSANTDLSAFKAFALYKRANVQFRAEAFNVFNQTTLYAPNATLSSPSFGQISSSTTGRVFQFALRLGF